MAKYLENKIVRFVSYTDLEGNPIDEGVDSFLNTTGMLCIYESEHKHPGEKFVYYYPCEPDKDMQRWINSVCGTLMEDGDVVVLRTDRIYTFECGELLSDDDIAQLWRRIFVR